MMFMFQICAQAKYCSKLPIVKYDDTCSQMIYLNVLIHFRLLFHQKNKEKFELTK